MKLIKDDTIYSKMSDELSKKLYSARLDYSNGDINGLYELVSAARGGNEILEFMKNNQNHLYMFGGGLIGKDFLTVWDKIFEIKAIVDNDETKWGFNTELNKRVISLDDIDDSDAAFIISSKLYSPQICEQLSSVGIIREKCFLLGEYIRTEDDYMYIDLECFDKSQEMNFVDCGALDGMSSLAIQKTFINTKTIYMFEPDLKNVEKVKANSNRFHVPFELYECGAWSKSDILSFDSNGNGSSLINKDGTTTIKVNSIDELLKDKKIDYIKMDIEGAEIEALRGASSIIREQKPILAISIYHKDDDIETIPRLILDLNPNYKFYIRHYTPLDYDTVLYAL